VTLQEVFDQLTYGELSQLSIGGAEAGEISEVNYEKIIAHINLGLTALYKRFPLKQDRVQIPLVPGTFFYSTLTIAPHLLKVEQVLTDGGIELPLNDAADMYSVNTPSASNLHVPADIVDQLVDLPDEYKTTGLTVVYRANHPRVVKRLGFFDPKRERLQLPDSHLEPLLFYVASRVHTPMGAGQFEGQMGNNYYAKYEASCQSLETANLNVDQGSQSNRLRENGWV
jgi:hypothetical protein